MTTCMSGTLDFPEAHSDQAGDARFEGIVRIVVNIKVLRAEIVWPL